MALYIKWRVEISDLQRKKIYEVEEETSLLAIHKALNMYQEEFGCREEELQIYCVLLSILHHKGW